MSRTNSALYHDLEGRFVDPRTEGDMAMRLWLQHPSAPKRSGLGLQHMQQLSGLGVRLQMVKDRIHACAEQVTQQDPLGHYKLGRLIRRMSLLRYGYDHIWGQLCALKQGWKYEPTNYNASAK